MIIHYVPENERVKPYALNTLVQGISFIDYSGSSSSSNEPDNSFDFDNMTIPQSIRIRIKDSQNLFREYTVPLVDETSYSMSVENNPSLQGNTWLEVTPTRLGLGDLDLTRYHLEGYIIKDNNVVSQLIWSDSDERFNTLVSTLTELPYTYVINVIDGEEVLPVMTYDITLTESK